MERCDHRRFHDAGDLRVAQPRPVLTKDEIIENTQTYLDQAFRILDEDKTPFATTVSGATK